MVIDIYEFLKENDINYILHTHEAVYTCEETEEHFYHIKGMHCKNLFLKDKKTKKYYLLTLPADKRMNIKEFNKILDSKVAFAKPDELLELLLLKPGSVSPFGLVNDSTNQVKFFIDRDVYDSKIVNFHPNVNNATLELDNNNFYKFLEVVGNDFQIIDM